MSIFKKTIASIGIGNVKIDTIINQKNFRPGEELTGEVKVTGGDVDQKVDKLYFNLMTYYNDVFNGAKRKTKYSIGKLELKESFIVKENENFSDKFSIELPVNMPVSGYGYQKIWLETEYEINNAVDPTDKDNIEILPHLYIQKIIDILKSEFSINLQNIENESNEYLTGDFPFVQKYIFSTKKSSLKKFYDRIDMIFFIEDSKLNTFVIFDLHPRNITGLYKEISNNDISTTTIEFSNTELLETNLIRDKLNKLFMN